MAVNGMTVNPSGLAVFTTKERNFMPRDDDFIRALLLEAEESNEPYLMALMTMNPDPEDLKRHVHAELLCDAGFFEAVNDGVYRITNQGHDYAQVIRNDDIWKKTKDGAAEVGGVTLGIMKDIAVAYVKQQATEKLGIPL